MKAQMEKPEPVWRDFITNEGDKIKVRKLKVSFLFDMVDFSDALSFDGATFDIFRPNEYAEGGLVLQTRREAVQMAKILLEEALERLTEKEAEDSKPAKNWPGTNIPVPQIDLEE